MIMTLGEFSTNIALTKFDDDDGSGTGINESFFEKPALFRRNGVQHKAFTPVGYFYPVIVP
jgi:hypothetical protein